VIEAIKSGRNVEEIYLQEHTNKDIVPLASDNKIKYIWMSKQDISKILDKGHQGVGAKVADYDYVELEEALAKDKPFKVFLMLDGLQDPHNLGAVLRSCDAFAVDGVIIPKNRSIGLNATVAKVSTGAIEHVDVIQVTNLHQTIRKLKEHGFWVVGTDMDTHQTIHDIRVDSDLVVIIGSEGTGMSRLVRDNCDYIVKIPMSGHVNSLNASVSAAITLYEIYRRRGE
jgi:23S rRNA (guanosine2251-2'-O)-methyltransferase